MSFKRGFNVKTKLPKSANKPSPGKRKPLFDDDEEEGQSKVKSSEGVQEIGEYNFEEVTAVVSEPTKSTSKAKIKGQPPQPPARKLKSREDDPSALVNAASLHESERRAKEALDIDSAIYDYDAAFDALHAKDAAKKAAEELDALERRPKYMDSLVESAKVRKKDELRARDKLLQREREAEGDDFADKETFVTGAYKAQQEEARKAEEEEQKRQELEDEKRRKVGMSGFHRQMLMEEERRHQEAEEAMKAAAQLVKEGKPVIEEEPKEKTAAEIAKELNAQGRNIIINDEGEVADKRQLLDAGLNIVVKPKRTAAVQDPSNKSATSQLKYQGRNASQRAVKDRQTAMIAEQIEQAAKRKADEEAEEQRKLEHASKSQKTAADISSAKERYLQRKREAAAAKAVAGK